MNSWQFSPDYTPQIIGLCGTIIGTLLGWILRYITDNSGKTNIIIEEYMNAISSANEYAYKSCLFLCNFSMKPKFIRNIKVIFYCDKEKIVESVPKIDIKPIEYRDIRDNKHIKTIKLHSYEPQILFIGAIIDKEDFQKLKKANKIILLYENTKGKIKKHSITDAFSLTDVGEYKEAKKF